MAYDEGLAHRVRELVQAQPALVEKRMFGGVAFMLRGNMACGVLNDELMVRVGPEAYQEALAQADVRPFDFTGRPMTGWIVVRPAAIESDAALREWVRQGMDYALSLPPK